MKIHVKSYDDWTELFIDGKYRGTFKTINSYSLINVLKEYIDIEYSEECIEGEKE